MTFYVDQNMSDLLEYFGFWDDPFHLFSSPNRHYYVTEPIHRIVEDVKFAVQERWKTVLIVGDTGLGKTSLCERLISMFWVAKAHRVIKVNGEYMRNSPEFIDALLQYNHLKSPRTKKLDTLTKFFDEKSSENGHILLIIDDAHKMHEEVAYIVLNLLGNSGDIGKGLQIIGLSAPNMTTSPISKLYRPNKWFSLLPLSLTDTQKMIEYRCRVSGNVSPFTDQAVLAIFEYTQGIPQKIVKLCRYAMRTAWIADQALVDSSIIHEAQAGIEKSIQS